MGNKTSNFSNQYSYGNEHNSLQKSTDLAIKTQYDSPIRNPSNTQSMPASPAYRQSDFESPTKLSSPRLLNRVFNTLSPQAVTRAFHFPEEDSNDSSGFHHRQLSKHQLFQAEVYHETFN
ncbi:unnamed protein product [Blepharisma stoltei]|uniref:Uncharacterized protein n=1 Tax=Blepharisma stoltei TaxID=1481888 RepID=A0AAU9K1Y6_9CILI|nr:unnamed protein product [Blepharisma stoltei]